MAKDYFDYKADFRFAERYEAHLIEFYQTVLIPLRNHEPTEITKEIKAIADFIMDNSQRMRSLAYEYTDFNSDIEDWIACVSNPEVCEHLCKVTASTKFILRGLRDEASYLVSYSIIRRAFDVLFNTLTCVIGYDIRKQENYKVWMTYLILAVCFINLAHQLKDLVEWAVDLYSRVK